MEIGEVYYPKKRSAWRAWLKRHHQNKTEIWLRRYKKAASQPSISYDDLVEECLCFGWIDSVVKKFDDESNVQRITPRRKKNTYLSELNRQRVWKLQHLGLMTPAGLDPIRDQVGSPQDPWKMPAWISQQLKADSLVWKNFKAFPRFYQRLKIGWMAELPESRRDEAQRRLDHLIKMTAQGKRYGTEPLDGLNLPGGRGRS